MDLLQPKRIKKQLLDYYIVQEGILHERPRGYARKVCSKMKSLHKVNICPKTVYSRVKGVIQGDRLVPLADVDGNPSHREGKDRNYAGFEAILDIVLPNLEDRDYLGLPANQVDSALGYAGGNIVICERDENRSQELRQIAKFLYKCRKRAILILNSNIWDYMNQTKSMFNVFDFDLMCVIPYYSWTWAKSLYRAAKPGPNVVNLTTTCGRIITEEEYENRRARFERGLVNQGFQLGGKSYFRYSDRTAPMRTARYVLVK